MSDHDPRVMNLASDLRRLAGDPRAFDDVDRRQLLLAAADRMHDAELWDEVVKLEGQAHMTHHLLGDFVRRLVSENRW